MRLRTLRSTRLVTDRGPHVEIVKSFKRNLYGCLPCPRCLSVYRYAQRDGYIHCDDCGKLQRAEFAFAWGDV